MFTKLDVAKYDCNILRVTVDLKLSPKLVEKLFSETYVQKPKTTAPKEAVYAATYSVNTKPHTVVAVVRHGKKAGECSVRLNYLILDMSKPPKELTSVNVLAGLLADVKQKMLIEVDAYFIYKKDNGWDSVIEIPSPLIEKKGDPTFTHIEAFRFGKRVDNKLQHTLQIERSENGDLRLHVHMHRGESGSITRELLKHLLEESSNLSKEFVTK